mmetsp:Transcript_40422/g.63106  ORF Transcript_40422/g.63106 Transcript_40422/m.63106 type:complete len:205 (-) Transcript_40422:103-717(-)|eukprot:CAMPEP_0184289980 /NCGR_PEP_ID=MMETSP1049-20130417/2338_1 /TAXON_ID=77928 /ORGANISM="Proteomonas sulcata, Strain CCMP704" /LENGTH=204 /DNA_ID=CAMNT_0026596991 /DNA_START=237 /DNA_END=851 /DNA_ORIENTATION=-
MSVAMEAGRRQICMIAGFIFGLAWLIFIDAIIHFNGCLDRVDQGDPCRWGKPSQNLTSAESVTDDSSFNWPWDGTPETTPPPHNGWHTLSGKYTLVFVPAWLSMISLFLVNTIDPKDLDMDPEWVTGAAPTLLKVWLFLGTLFGIGGVVMAIWVHIDLYARHSDMKEGPGLAGIVQAVLLTVSSCVFWVGRSWGAVDAFNEPFL